MDKLHSLLLLLAAASDPVRQIAVREKRATTAAAVRDARQARSPSRCVTTTTRVRCECGRVAMAGFP
jgi:hypothetical protein